MGERGKFGHKFDVIPPYPARQVGDFFLLQKTSIGGVLMSRILFQFALRSRQGSSGDNNPRRERNFSKPLFNSGWRSNRMRRSSP